MSPVGIAALRAQVVHELAVGRVAAVPADLLFSVAGTAFRTDAGGARWVLVTVDAAFRGVAHRDLLNCLFIISYHGEPGEHRGVCNGSRPEDFLLIVCEHA